MSKKTLGEDGCMILLLSDPNALQKGLLGKFGFPSFQKKLPLLFHKPRQRDVSYFFFLVYGGPPGEFPSKKAFPGQI